MNTTEQSVLQFVREQDVRFVKLSFCDIFGNLQNISILSFLSCGSGVWGSLLK